MPLRLMRIGDEPSHRSRRSTLRALLPGDVGETEPTTSPGRGTGNGDVEPPSSCPACSTSRTANPDLQR